VGFDFQLGMFMSIETSHVNIPHLPDDLLNYAESVGHGELHIKMDKETGLRAIVSIHSTNLGPALGGCRFIEYNNASEAIYDAMRLARGMTYKAAISNLPLGGGKSVIMRPKVIRNREALFEAFGSFVNDLGGRYITAIDSGTTVEDMDVIQRKTPYVTTTSRADESHGDPSFATALGVFSGILAAVKFRLGKTDLDGLHFAIQGTGHVGYLMAKRLHAAGAKLTVCDMNMESAQRCANEFGAHVVDPKDIFQVECDVFSPCALGGILNDHTIPQIKAKIVAGSANNQLGLIKHGQTLLNRGILYIPDYVINAGGLIEVVGIYHNDSPEKIKKDVEHIHDTVLMICQQAQEQNIDPAVVADNIAAKRIYG
jgi:leucine dehydrogenase